MVIFLLLLRKFWIQTWFCNCLQYLCLFYIVFECTSGIHDQGMMLVLPNQLLCLVLSTSDQYFVSFQPRCHPHTQIRMTLFDGVRISIPNWKLSPNRVAAGFSQIDFTILVLLKDDRTDFAQEERLVLPYWTMILAICVVVDESTCLDTPICEFSIILEHVPFLPGIKQILHPALVLRTLAVWIWYPWFLLLSFVMLMFPVQRKLRKILNHLSQCRLGVQLDLCIFGALSPIQHFSNDICPSMMQNELLCPSSLLHRSPLICFWLSSGSTPESFPISHYLSTAAFAAGIFIAWGIGINLCTELYCCGELSNFLQYGPHDISVEILPYAFLWIHWLPRYTQI